MSPLEMLWWAFGVVILWTFLAACAFAWLEEKSRGAFRQWYDEAPHTWVKIAMWALWPVLLGWMIYEMRRVKR